MNFELVGRMAPMQLTVSPQLLSPLANFAHSSKVRCPACMMQRTTALRAHARSVTLAFGRTCSSFRQPSEYVDCGIHQKSECRFTRPIDEV